MTAPTTHPVLLAERSPLANVRVVDAHAHVGPYSRFHIPNPDPDTMIEVMDRCGVDSANISSLLAVELDARAGNEATAEVCRTHRGRFRAYAVINPWQDPLAELDRWRGDPAFVGIKLHPDLHRYPLGGERYEPVWEFAAAAQVPVLTHTWAGSAFNDLEHVAQVSDRHPECWILAGHAGVAPAFFDQAIVVAARHERVLLELCGSSNHGRWITRMCERLGSDKVVFGSDFPFIDLRMSLGRVLFADLDESMRAGVLAGTIDRLMARGRFDA